MFKEIETELMSIISTDPIEKIAHLITKDIAKTVELVYGINTERVEKVYTEEFDKDLCRATIVYHNDQDNADIGEDTCMINGKIYRMIFVPYSMIDVNNANAILLSKSIIKYITCRVELIMNKCEQLTLYSHNNKMLHIIAQSVPVITCAVMRNIFNGTALSKLIYMSLCDIMDSYKTNSSEIGINSILNLFDEGLGVTELLDNGLICAIPHDDVKYPGIWGIEEETKPDTDEIKLVNNNEEISEEEKPTEE